jgi:hypothetical protein
MKINSGIHCQFHFLDTMYKIYLLFCILCLRLHSIGSLWFDMVILGIKENLESVGILNFLYWKKMTEIHVCDQFFHYLRFLELKRLT